MLNKLFSIFNRSYKTRHEDEYFIIHKGNKKKNVVKINKLTLAVSIEN